MKGEIREWKMGNWGTKDVGYERYGKWEIRVWDTGS